MLVHTSPQARNFVIYIEFLLSLDVYDMSSIEIP